MVPSNPIGTGEHSAQLALPALSVPLAEALSSRAIGALIRLLGLTDIVCAAAESLSLRYEGHGISTKYTSPAYRIVFVIKALRNLSNAFSFF